MGLLEQLGLAGIVPRPATSLPPNPNLELEFDDSKLATIVLAGGCFWGTDAFLARVPGVAHTECGYANGVTPNPTYRQVCGGQTGYAEAVRVQYDPERVSLEKLLGEYFKTIDPTSINRQGGDAGPQYRTGIFYLADADLPIIEKVMAEQQRNYSKPLAVQVEPLTSYYRAEDYHQNYLEKNPGGYCHVDMSKLGQ